MTFTEKMMPGQTPYTAAELETLHALVADAAAGDPGETDEPRVPYYRTTAYRAAMAQPFALLLYADWRTDPTVVGFQTEEEARAFASVRPEPLIDLRSREDDPRGKPTGGGNIIGVRRMIAHPATILNPPLPFRNDFPDTRV